MAAQLTKAKHTSNDPVADQVQSNRFGYSTIVGVKLLNGAPEGKRNP